VKNPSKRIPHGSVPGSSVAARDINMSQEETSHFVCVVLSVWRQRGVVSTDSPASREKYRFTVAKLMSVVENRGFRTRFYLRLSNLRASKSQTETVRSGPATPRNSSQMHLS